MRYLLIVTTLAAFLLTPQYEGAQLIVRFYGSNVTEDNIHNFTQNVEAHFSANNIELEISDVDECQSTKLNTCSEHATCENTAGSFTCTCNVGFSENNLINKGKNCTDVDECEGGEVDCHAHANCANTVGSYVCACNQGFSGNDTFCQDIDECSTSTHNCSENATCTNTDGSFQCTCKDNYTGDGFSCTEVDECQVVRQPCPAYSECINMPGMYSCVCHPGYRLVLRDVLSHECVVITTTNELTTVTSVATTNPGKPTTNDADNTTPTRFTTSLSTVPDSGTNLSDSSIGTTNEATHASEKPTIASIITPTDVPTTTLATFPVVTAGSRTTPGFLTMSETTIGIASSASGDPLTMTAEKTVGSSTNTSGYSTTVTGETTVVGSTNATSHFSQTTEETRIGMPTTTPRDPSTTIGGSIVSSASTKSDETPIPIRKTTVGSTMTTPSDLTTATEETTVRSSTTTAGHLSPSTEETRIVIATTNSSDSSTTTRESTFSSVTTRSSETPIATEETTVGSAMTTPNNLLPKTSTGLVSSATEEAIIGGGTTAIDHVMSLTTKGTTVASTTPNTISWSATDRISTTSQPAASNSISSTGENTSSEEYTEKQTVGNSPSSTVITSGVTTLSNLNSSTFFPHTTRTINITNIIDNNSTLTTVNTTSADSSTTNPKPYSPAQSRTTTPETTTAVRDTTKQETSDTTQSATMISWSPYSITTTEKSQLGTTTGLDSSELSTSHDIVQTTVTRETPSTQKVTSTKKPSTSELTIQDATSVPLPLIPELTEENYGPVVNDYINNIKQRLSAGPLSPNNSHAVADAFEKFLDYGSPVEPKLAIKLLDGLDAISSSTDDAPLDSRVASRLTRFADNLLQTMDLVNGSFTSETDTMTLEARRVPATEVEENGVMFERDGKQLVDLPPAFLLDTNNRAKRDTENGDDFRLAFIGYTDARLFIDETVGSLLTSSSTSDKPEFVNSPVLSASVAGKEINVSENYATINLKLIHEDGQTETFPNRTQKRRSYYGKRCVYWDYASLSWLNDGCEMVQDVKSTITCRCNHLTNFAVIMKVDIIAEDIVLNYLSYIGSGLSLLGLILTILTYSIFKSLRKHRSKRILLNFCTSLCGVYIAYLLGIAAKLPSSQAQCIAAGFFLHYFTISVMTWMLIEVVDMYLMFVKIWTSFSNYLLKTLIVGWIVPLVIAVVTLGAHFAVDDKDFYTGEQRIYPIYEEGRNNVCWLGPYGMLFAFIIPSCIILIVNLILFTIVLYHITCKRSNNIGMTTTKKPVKARQHIINAMALLLLVGPTWLVGYFMNINPTGDDVLNRTLAYIFVGLNAFQGVWIFVVFTVRPKGVRRLWKQTFLKRRLVRSDAISSSRSWTNGGHRNTGSSVVKSPRPSITPSAGTFSTSQTSTKTQILVLKNNQKRTVANKISSSSSSSGQSASSYNRLFVKAVEHGYHKSSLPQGITHERSTSETTDTSLMSTLPIRDQPQDSIT